MTVVPLPDTPCVRVRLIYNEAVAGESGSRFYLSYSGSAPSGANCATLASDIAGAWNTDLASVVSSGWTLNEVDVLDIATNSGLSGQWTGSHLGQRTGNAVAANCATNVEFGIARRYRGGKPRMYLPPGADSDLASITSWSSTFLGLVNTAMANFMSAIEALSVGSMGTLQHVNLSYYSGFRNITNSSGRERAVPTYRTTAQHDNVTGYFAKAIVGSQRRRRTATTP